MSAMRFSAMARLCRPCSPAARPSAICFWRVSMARIRCGHTNFDVNQMNAANATACITSVKLMFMAAPWQLDDGRRTRYLSRGEDQRIAEREQHREADADDERRVDQAEQQEHLRLQLRHQLRLARGAFEKPRTHDADADARAERAEADHETDADAGIGLDHRQCLQFVHFLSFLSGGLYGETKKGSRQWCSCAIETYTMVSIMKM